MTRKEEYPPRKIPQTPITEEIQHQKDPHPAKKNGETRDLPREGEEKPREVSRD
jgi:hypothetical protein